MTVDNWYEKYWEVNNQLDREIKAKAVLIDQLAKVTAERDALMLALVKATHPKTARLTLGVIHMDPSAEYQQVAAWCIANLSDEELLAAGASDD